MLVVFAPIQATLLTVLALVIADLVFGIAVSLKKKRKVTSRGIRRTIIKLLCYEVALALIFLAEKNLSLPSAVFSFAAALIGAAELKSLLEHCDALTGESLFRMVINRLAPEKKEDQK